MAFGIKRCELDAWKQRASAGEIAILTHYWYDRRFPDASTVTKVACSNRERLVDWGKHYGLRPEWIHERDKFPHFDLLENKQIEVLKAEGLLWQLERLSNT